MKLAVVLLILAAVTIPTPVSAQVFPSPLAAENYARFKAYGNQGGGARPDALDCQLALPFPWDILLCPGLPGPSTSDMIIADCLRRPVTCAPQYDAMCRVREGDINTAARSAAFCDRLRQAWEYKLGGPIPPKRYPTAREGLLAAPPPKAGPCVQRGDRMWCPSSTEAPPPPLAQAPMRASPPSAPPRQARVPGTHQRPPVPCPEGCKRSDPESEP